MERVITNAGVPISVPVIPAAQLKGAMRRGVTEDVVERMPGGVDFSDFHPAGLRGVKGSDKAGPTRAMRRSANTLTTIRSTRSSARARRDSASSFRRS